MAEEFFISPLTEESDKEIRKNFHKNIGDKNSSTVCEARTSLFK
jgi:hypothetical protein